MEDRVGHIRTIGTYFCKMNRGGTEKVISLLIPIWLELGYEVVLFKDEQNDDEYRIPESVKQIVLKPEMFCEDTRNIGWNRLLESFHIDVMVYHYWLSHYLKADIMYFKRKQIPFILYVHGLFSIVYKYRLEQADYLHKIAKDCTAVANLCTCGQRYFEELGAKSYLVNNPCDQGLLKAHHKTDNGYNIIWFGGSAYNKQPLDAIHIFHLVRQAYPSAKMFFMGEMHPDNSEVVYKEIERLKLKSDIEIVGFTDDTHKYYEQADVYLSTSDAEGFMFTLLEAQAYGLPTVMYELPYLSLVKNANGAIRSVPQNDAGAAANAISEIFDDPEIREKMAKAAKINADSFLNADIKGQWAKIFYEVENVSAEKTEKKDEMLSLLIDHILEGDAVRMENTLDYKVGNCLLKAPRKLYRFLKNKK